MEVTQLEKDILSTIQTELNKAIVSTLTKYGSPLDKIINSVVEEHAQQIKDKTKTILVEVLNAEDFESNLREAFANQMARKLISTSDSLITKVSNDLKQDMIFRSKLTVAISEIIQSLPKDK